MRAGLWLLIAATVVVTAVAASQLHSAAAAATARRALSATPAPQVSFVKAAGSGGWIVEATGVGDRAPSAVLDVRVAGTAAGLPPMVGRYDVRDTTVRFIPRYPLVGGLTYVARLRSPRDVTATFTVPQPRHAAATFVDGIFPADAAVPENLLRLYVTFSAPMRMGEAATHLRLVDAEGRTVDGAFLQLEEELWDPSRRRLTVLFDPGRIKRGLRTNLQRGAPLVAGHGYRLVVDAAWRDGTGHPLREAFERTLRVGTADRRAPDARRWHVGAVQAGGRDPLVVHFDETLDRALVEQSIVVLNQVGGRVAGTISVPASAREWRFTPADAWRSGTYRLSVSTELEDVAGNSLRRVFDSDLRVDPAPDVTDEQGAIELPFDIAVESSAQKAPCGKCGGTHESTPTIATGIPQDVNCTGSNVAAGG